MKKVKLSQGLFALVDDADFEMVNQFKWSATRGSGNGNKWYAIRRSCIDSTGQRKRIAMHRFIMGLDIGGLVVDHLDDDGLDNRRRNLEVVTQKVNNLRRVGKLNERRKSAR